MITQLLIVLIGLIISGCNYFNNNKIMEFNITSSNHLNPDHNNRASPLLINIYQLKDKIPFKTLNYTNITQKSYQTLRGSLIDFDSIVIRPGEKRNYHQKIEDKTRFIGIAASYQNIENAQWKKIIELTKNLKPLKIKLHFNELNIKANQY